jgi:hypothetical protein
MGACKVWTVGGLYGAFLLMVVFELDVGREMLI